MVSLCCEGMAAIDNSEQFLDDFYNACDPFEPLPAGDSGKKIALKNRINTLAELGRLK
ncbi:hypothetical protein [Oscillatoria sp. FACHB-1406]|uniref:hypothetical protein n=1 Tax=Oscillatoria sp. FACHB-1406 TaxID=2692846 RepID=UPI0019C0BD88|nr:hypothetical protein [Oscillatoria sp. FACHB-1406]MBD2576309.1 hypothetical protein [Oscillatoria sp. FACHB-1406]